MLNSIKEWTWLQKVLCNIGVHYWQSDLNAKYEFCGRCRKRRRVI